MADPNARASEPPVKKKFSLFKKKLHPSQAPCLKPGQNHTDAFSRAKDLFPIHVKEREITREKRAAGLERKRSSLSGERSSSSPRSEKRRKTSNEDVNVNVNVNVNELGSETEDEGFQDRECSSSTSGRQSQMGSPQKRCRSPASLMGRFAKDVQSQTRKSEQQEAIAKGYISVSDSDSDDVAPVAQPISRSGSPQIAIVDDGDGDGDGDGDEDALSEEEFPELLAKARENKKLADLAQQRRNAEWANTNHEPNRNMGDDDVFQDKQKDEPVLEIFISSRLENTKNLVIKRKLHQRLREVRQAWCDRQEWEGERMADDLKDSILLTWRNKRLFDSMTCASLNLDFNTNGDLTSSGDGFSSGRIHMEAWTNDLWDECCRAAEAEEISGDDDEPIEEVAPEPSSKMRLILKAQSKDIKEFKTYVKPTTTIQKLVDGFRMTNKIPANEKIILTFDGDQLDLDGTVEDAGFEDMDTIEVLIR